MRCGSAAAASVALHRRASATDTTLCLALCPLVACLLSCKSRAANRSPVAAAAAATELHHRTLSFAAVDAPCCACLLCCFYCGRNTSNNKIQWRSGINNKWLKRGEIWWIEKRVAPCSVELLLVPPTDGAVRQASRRLYASREPSIKHPIHHHIAPSPAPHHRIRFRFRPGHAYSSSAEAAIYYLLSKKNKKEKKRNNTHRRPAHPSVAIAIQRNARRASTIRKRTPHPPLGSATWKASPFRRPAHRSRDRGTLTITEKYRGCWWGLLPPLGLPA